MTDRLSSQQEVKHSNLLNRTKPYPHIAAHPLWYAADDFKSELDAVRVERDEWREALEIKVQEWTKAAEAYQAKLDEWETAEPGDDYKRLIVRTWIEGLTDEEIRDAISMALPDEFTLSGPLDVSLARAALLATLNLSRSSDGDLKHPSGDGQPAGPRDVNREGTVRGPMNDGERMAETIGETIYQMGNTGLDPKRPFDGQPHTDQGNRGKQVVETLRFRDVADCFVKGWLYARGCSEGFVEGAEITYNDIYAEHGFDGDVDPLAVMQNMLCEMEKRMGIYPNVPKLTPDV